MSSLTATKDTSTRATPKAKSSFSPVSIIYSGVIVVLLIGLIFPVRWMVADVAINTVKRNLETWETATTVSSLADWNLTNNALIKALRYHSGQADYYYLKGLLYEWRSFIADSPVLSADEQAEIRQKSINAYRQATQLRPTWPETWAYLARQKAYQNEFDAELSFALDKALTLGEGEPGVQLLATEVIALAWPFAAEDTTLRVKSLTNIEQGLVLIHVREVRQHLGFLKEKNLLPSICPLLNLDKLNDLASLACKNTAPEAFPL